MLNECIKESLRGGENKSTLQGRLSGFRVVAYLGICRAWGLKAQGQGLDFQMEEGRIGW